MVEGHCTGVAFVFHAHEGMVENRLLQLLCRHSGELIHRVLIYLHAGDDERNEQQ